MLILTIFSCKISKACWEQQTINYYMYRVMGVSSDDSGISPFNEFWKNYLGKDLSTWDLNSLCHYSIEEFYEDRDQGKSNNEIINLALTNKDDEMINYLLNLITYYDVIDQLYNTWNYPSEDEAKELKDKFNSIYETSKNYSGKLKDRYTLMSMRCLFQLEKYAEVEKLWLSEGIKAEDNACKQTMKALYAGSLYHQKKVDAALEIFVQLNDIQSIKFCTNENRNLKGIQETYNKNHNHVVLPFLIQDFVNMTQETNDEDYGRPSDFHSIENKEAKDFVVFANQVADSKATNDPVMWKSAAAMVDYLLGNYDNAKKEIDAAMNLQGSEVTKDNARAIKLLVYTRNMNYTTANSNYLLNEFKWLDTKSKTDSYFRCATVRIVFQNLIPANKDNNTNLAFLLNSVFGKYEYGFEDHLSGQEMENVYNYVSNPKKVTPFESWLISKLEISQDYYFDNIGTKYLSEHNLSKAETYLSKVKLDYYRSHYYANLMALRDYNVERWFTNQVVSSEDEYSDDVRKGLLENQRYKYCKELQLKLLQYNNASENNKYELAYQLGVMYQQASQWGNCWYLLHDTWSVGGLKYSKNEIDFEAKALEYLNIATQTTDAELLGNAKYAILWINRQKLNDEYSFTDKDQEAIENSLKSVGDYIQKYGSINQMENCDVIIGYVRGQMEDN